MDSSKLVPNQKWLGPLQQELGRDFYRDRAKPVRKLLIGSCLKPRGLLRIGLGSAVPGVSDPVILRHLLA